jgi:hypothetical protein
MADELLQSTQAVSIVDFVDTFLLVGITQCRPFAFDGSADVPLTTLSLATDRHPIVHRAP